ncbi:MAG TPA: methionyl-tRNA formyltransferase [Mycobacteriales bacterium]|nr:methionyl-tRNA formyltransferase [Mycobacteriales bacterium]
MRLVLAGTPAAALPSFDALLASPRHELVAVVTRPDARAGRGHGVSESPLKQRARAAGIEVLSPVRPSEPEFLARLREIAPDCCPVVAYGALVPPAALDVPAAGWVNLHFSLLPAWRGAAPVQHAILAGDDITGATTFRLEAGLDTGPVYGVMTTEIGARETAGELVTRLAADGAALLVATLDGIEDGTVVPLPQAAEGVSLAPKITADDARVGWGAAAIAVDRQVRACTPVPGAWTQLRGRRLRLGPVEPLGEDAGLGPGELSARRDEVLVGTGSGPVRLQEVRPEGRGPMAAADWARGLRLAEGERFG